MKRLVPAFLIAVLALSGRATAIDGVPGGPAPIGPRPGDEVELFAAGLTVGNDGACLGDYGMYNGAFLTDDEKHRLLGSVPDDGLRVFSGAGVKGASIIRGQLGIWLGARAGENMTLPKDVLDLVLFGNEIERTYRLDDAHGEALAIGEAGVFYSYPVGGPGRDTYVGGAVKVISGLAYGRITQATGSVYSGQDEISGDGRIVVRTSRGGMGYAADIGLVHRTNSNIRISAYVTDIVSSITWKRACHEEINTFLFDSVVFGDEDADSLIKSDNESLRIASFSTSLAPRLTAGISGPWHGWELTLTYGQGLREGALASSEPEVMFRGARALTSWLGLKACIGLDGRSGVKEGLHLSIGGRTRVVFGAGVSPLPRPSQLKHASLDLAVTRSL